MRQTSLKFCGLSVSILLFILPSLATAASVVVPVNAATPQTRFGSFADVATLTITEQSSVQVLFTNLPKLDGSGDLSVENFSVVDNSGLFQLALSGDAFLFVATTLSAGDYSFDVSGVGNGNTIPFFGTSFGNYLAGAAVQSLVPPAAVPIPPALWLLTSALLGFFVVGRRKQQHRLDITI